MRSRREVETNKPIYKLTRTQYTAYSTIYYDIPRVAGSAAENHVIEPCC